VLKSSRFWSANTFTEQSALTSEGRHMADRLPQNPGIKALMASCTRARLSGALSCVKADFLKFDAKAKAHYLRATVLSRSERTS
jgi:hypothetical protein